MASDYDVWEQLRDLLEKLFDLSSKLLEEEFCSTCSRKDECPKSYRNLESMEVMVVAVFEFIAQGLMQLVPPEAACALAETLFNEWKRKFTQNINSAKMLKKFRFVDLYG